MHEYTHDGIVRAYISTQPRCTSESLPSEHDLAASKYAIMTDIQEHARSDSMKVSTPSAENMRMNLNMVPDSVFAELYEQQLDRYHSSEGHIHQGFAPAAGFAGDELIAPSGGYVEEADWNADVDDDESLLPKSPCPSLVPLSVNPTMWALNW
jgi:hypothetical protein